MNLTPNQKHAYTWNLLSGRPHLLDSTYQYSTVSKPSIAKHRDRKSEDTFNGYVCQWRYLFHADTTLQNTMAWFLHSITRKAYIYAIVHAQEENRGCNMLSLTQCEQSPAQNCPTRGWRDGAVLRAAPAEGVSHVGWLMTTYFSNTDTLNRK